MSDKPKSPEQVFAESLLKAFSIGQTLFNQTYSASSNPSQLAELEALRERNAELEDELGGARRRLGFAVEDRNRFYDERQTLTARVAALEGLLNTMYEHASFEHFVGCPAKGQVQTECTCGARDAHNLLVKMHNPLPPAPSAPAPAPVVELSHEAKLVELRNNPQVGDRWKIAGVEREFVGGLVNNTHGDKCAGANMRAYIEFNRKDIADIRLAPRLSASAAFDDPDVVRAWASDSYDRVELRDGTIMYRHINGDNTWFKDANTPEQLRSIPQAPEELSKKFAAMYADWKSRSAKLPDAGKLPASGSTS